MTFGDDGEVVMPREMWARVDSTPGHYSQHTADEWAGVRDGQCIALRSDRTRCDRFLSDDAGFCEFHFQRLTQFITDQLAQLVARAARIEDPRAFRFMVDSAALKDAMAILEEAPMCVYFMAVGDIVKIGRSRNPMGRLTQIRQGSAKRPDGYNYSETVLLGCIPGSARVEAQIHRLLSSYRLEGEWFRLTPTVITALDHFLYDGPVPKSIEVGLRDMYSADGGARLTKRLDDAAAYRWSA